MDKQVTIYTTPTCVHCHEAKEFLDNKGIEYTEYDVSESDEKKEEMREKAGRLTVPVIEVGDEVMVGFDGSKLSGLLGV